MQALANYSKTTLRKAAVPPELANDQELSLKKRARRRLVGAIALVLLMVTVLPMVLQDRASLAPQPAIKIIMPEARNSVVEVNVDKLVIAAPLDTMPVQPAVTDDPSAANEAVGGVAASNRPGNLKSEAEKKNDENKNLLAKPDKALEVKVGVSTLAEPKLAEPKAVEVKTQNNKTNFSIQVGVYSDAANVKQLQLKLKEAGYTFHSEKITTPQGEKVRLRAGDYASRSEAADALVKLQGLGLSGMVISHE
ncbi:MAG: sporulation protein [Methylotenera sp.]|nr:sporulation protein [Methylotenera sp.]